MRKFLAAFLTLGLLLTAGCAYIEIPTPTPQAPTEPAVPPSPINPTWSPPPLVSAQAPLVLPSIADVVALVKPSVVAINTQVVTLDLFNRPFTQKGAGSGWIIDKDGIIVTNNHVVEDAQIINVILDDGSTYTVDPKASYTDKLNDLAILRVNATNLPNLKVGESSKLRVGDWVVAIGNALGQGIGAKQGIISRKGVSIEIDQGQALYDLIETSAAINPGNSGGPLVNLAGEVIGITSAKIANVGVEGMGYAISAETAVPILQQLIKTGYVVRPWLGVWLHTVDQFTALRYRLSVNSGVLITEVVSGGPAAKAGLAPGDVITAVNSKDITADTELMRLIHSSQIGQLLEVTFWRGDAKSTAQVILEESPPP